jgi:hypothetical protein
MNYLGGYLLFPSTQTYADLGRVTLQAMELIPADVKVALPREGFAIPSWSDLPVEDALNNLDQHGGGIGVSIENQPETYWFEPAAGPASLPDLWVEDEAWLHPPAGLYPVINISIADVALRNKAPYTPIEQFAERWLRLCEQGHAIYGYFSHFEFGTEREYLDERIFPHLHNGDLPKLLEDSDEKWLVYLGPELAKRWRQEQIRWPTSWSCSEPFLSLELPSGAQFIRTSEGVFGEKVPDYETAIQ